RFGLGDSAGASYGKAPRSKIQDPSSNRFQAPISSKPPKNNLELGAWSLELGTLLSRRAAAALDRDLLDGPRRAVTLVDHGIRLAVDLVDEAARLPMALARLRPADEVPAHIEL